MQKQSTLKVCRLERRPTCESLLQQFQTFFFIGGPGLNWCG